MVARAPGLFQEEHSLGREPPVLYDSSMRKQTPPARDGFADALEEAEDFANATVAEHAEVLLLLCQTALRQLDGNPDREAILEYQDPLPEHSRRLIEELRARWAKRLESA